MLLFASIIPWLGFFLGVALITTLLLRKSQRRLGRRRIGSIDPPIVHVPEVNTPWLSSSHRTESSLDSQEIELYEFTRELTGRLDSKIAVLQQLIIQSEAKISELRQLLDELDKRGH